MFLIKTEEKQADPRRDLVHRVTVYRDDMLHYIATWDEDRDDAWNHRNGALASLLKSSPVPGFTPHHIIGAAPIPGEDFWVVVVEEGEF